MAKISEFLSGNADTMDKAEKSESRSKQPGSKPSSRDPSPFDKTGQYYSILHLEPKMLNDDVKVKEAFDFKNKFRDQLK